MTIEVAQEIIIDLYKISVIMYLRMIVRFVVHRDGVLGDDAIGLLRRSPSNHNAGSIHW